MNEQQKARIVKRRYQEAYRAAAYLKDICKPAAEYWRATERNDEAAVNAMYDERIAPVVANFGNPDSLLGTEDGTWDAMLAAFGLVRQGAWVASAEAFRIAQESR